MDSAGDSSGELSGHRLDLSPVFVRIFRLEDLNERESDHLAFQAPRHNPEEQTCDKRALKLCSVYYLMRQSQRKGSGRNPLVFTVDLKMTK